MEFGLGDFCDDDDKYLDPEAYYDPYFCQQCDEFFTNTGAFEMHKLLHEYGKSSSSRKGPGGRGGGAKQSTSGKRNKRNVQPKAALSAESSDEDCPDKDILMAILGMAKGRDGPPMEPKKPRSRNSHASKAAGGRDHSPYACDKCSGIFGSRGDYWFHMTKTHRECLACKQKFNADLRIDDHYRSSPNCLGWPAGVSVGGESNGTDKGMRGSMDHPALAVDASGTSLGREPASCRKDCGGDSNSNGSKLLPCSLCDDIPSSDSALNLHMNRAHNKCLRCKVQFESQTELMQHFSRSEVHKFCPSCSLDFMCEEALATHYKTHHPGVTSTARSKEKMGMNDDASVTKAASYGCQFCTKDVKTFSAVEQLESHLQRDHVRCFPCKRDFGKRKSLLNHLVASARHNYCIRCETDFISPRALKFHGCSRFSGKSQPGSDNSEKAMLASLLLRSILALQDEDSDNEAYLCCVICYEEFQTEEDMMWHDYDSHLWCYECDKQMPSARAYNEHKLTVHNQCSECGVRCITAEKLAEHGRLNNHRYQDTSTNLSSDRNVKCKKFVCDSCLEGVFETEEKLAEHLILCYDREEDLEEDLEGLLDLSTE